MKEKWTVVSNVYAENSFGIVAEEENVTLSFQVEVGEVKPDGKQTGWFAWHDSSGDWYAEGGLWFRNNTLVDYDGVFSLSAEILEKLHEAGFDVRDMVETCAPELNLEGVE